MSAYSKIYTVLFFISLFCASCYAQSNNETEDNTQLRDPFESWPRIVKRLEEEAKLHKSNTKTEITRKQISFNLTGILRGKRNLAIINEEVVGEGDIIEGNKVLQINQRAVILGNAQEKIILEIKDDF